VIMLDNATCTIARTMSYMLANVTAIQFSTGGPLSQKCRAHIFSKTDYTSFA
jgi:hypothetical protein